MEASVPRKVSPEVGDAVRDVDTESEIELVSRLVAAAAATSVRLTFAQIDAALNGVTEPDLGAEVI